MAAAMVPEQEQADTRGCREGFRRTAPTRRNRDNRNIEMGPEPAVQPHGASARKLPGAKRPSLWPGSGG
eukprot:10691599-Alexandrium_andersonii.AAC.1